MLPREARPRSADLALMLTWELPQTLLGLLVLGACRLGGAALSGQWLRGRHCVRTQGVGVSLGAIVFWFAAARGEPYDILRHELGHCVQSRLLGPAYLPLVGLPSILRAGYAWLYFLRHRRRWMRYRDGYPERWADRLAPAAGPWLPEA